MGVLSASLRYSADIESKRCFHDKAHPLRIHMCYDRLLPNFKKARVTCPTMLLTMLLALIDKFWCTTKLYYIHM